MRVSRWIIIGLLTSAAPTLAEAQALNLPVPVAPTLVDQFGGGMKFGADLVTQQQAAFQVQNQQGVRAVEEAAHVLNANARASLGSADCSADKAAPNVDGPVDLSKEVAAYCEDRPASSVR